MPDLNLIPDSARYELIALLNIVMYELTFNCLTLP